MQRNPLLAPLLGAALLLALPGCAALAGAGIGYVISREVLPDKVQQAHLQDDADRVWRYSKQSLEILHDPATELRFDEKKRRAEAEVNGAKVTLDVEAIDTMHSKVSVRAEKPLAADAATAEEILDTIVVELTRDR